MILPLAVAMLFCTVGVRTAVGQDQAPPAPMTNAEVIKLVKGGLSNGLIVKTIKSRPNQFDLSADGLLALKNNGVSDEVIESMMSGSSNAAHSGDPESSSSEDDSALWLYDGEKKIRLEETRVTAEAKAGIGVAFGGSIHSYATLSEAGPAAVIRVANRSPLFGKVLVPENLRVAELVQLVKLEFDSTSKRRRVQIGKVAEFRGTRTGIPQEARIAIAFDDVGEVRFKGKPAHLYSFRPEAPLAPGEYAIVLPGYRFLDFGID